MQSKSAKIINAVLFIIDLFELCGATDSEPAIIFLLILVTRHAKHATSESPPFHQTWFRLVLFLNLAETDAMYAVRP